MLHRGVFSWEQTDVKRCEFANCMQNSDLISLFYRAAGGASRPETELEGWFLVNSEHLNAVY